MLFTIILWIGTFSSFHKMAGYFEIFIDAFLTIDVYNLQSYVKFCIFWYSLSHVVKNYFSTQKSITFTIKVRWPKQVFLLLFSLLLQKPQRNFRWLLKDQSRKGIFLYFHVFPPKVSFLDPKKRIFYLIGPTKCFFFKWVNMGIKKSRILRWFQNGAFYFCN
jgi:transcription elongation factor GreA-like protein